MKGYGLSFFLLVGILKPAFSLLGQQSFAEPVISEREYRFRDVEQRALDLSRRLSEITGTEPVQLIDRNQSFDAVRYQNSAQRSFDALPGPLQELEPLPEPEEDEEKAQPLVFASEVKRVVPTTQQRKGDYYIMPMLGLAFSGKTKFKDGINDSSFEGDLGNVVLIQVGKRWDNWTANIKVGYQYLDYDENLITPNNPLTPTRITANEESYFLTAGGGYSIPITERLSTNGGMNLGFAWRKNIYNIETDIENTAAFDWFHNTTELDSSLVFTYELSLGFEYLFVNNFSGYLGYRVMGLSSNESFEGAFQHIIELGVGANF